MNLRGLMKKETTRRLRLVEELYYSKEIVTSDYLMDKLKCSLPALISDIRFLNSEPLPLKVTKIKGVYTVDFDFYATIDTVYAYILRTSLEYQTIRSLFFEKSSSIQPAANRLNCSFSNMQRYLKSIDSEVTGWDISVEHRPIRLGGDENAVRHLYYLFFKESRLAFTEYPFSKEIIKVVDRLIRKILDDNHIKNNMTIHFQLMHSFLIGLQRQKCGQYISDLPLDSGLIIPDVSRLQYMTRLFKRELRLDFSDLQLRECLWPLFSHQLILNRQQQSLAHKRNKRLAQFYELHHLLLEEVSRLLAVPLSQSEIVEALRLLGNELFCYYPHKKTMDILQETDQIMVDLIDNKFSREIRKLEDIVRRFLIPQEREDFIPKYIRCLVTSIDNLLQRLVDSDKPIKVLLLSDTSTTQERFWHATFPAFIKGSVQYEYFETPFIKQGQLNELTKQYDLIVTNVTMPDLMPACPLIAVNAYPTAKDFERIQRFINQYESLPSRKEQFNELTPST
ncbi:helix-turn-helix domain-containing protein [Enterococcus gilvus]|uniref:helix-turn-helix domain-containing protein n=1 Tax=Enterococcus gilvus TaxID=160453 RepID=UPI003D6A5701